MRRLVCAIALASCTPSSPPAVTIEPRTPAPQPAVSRPEVQRPLDGAELARRFACATCHDVDRRLAGPPWRALFGSRVVLADGRTVIADEDYIVRSIFDPRAELVDGYAPVMPSFRGQIDDAQAHAIARYIASLANDAP